MDEQKTIKRVDYIDIAKAIGIILVILGHINNYNESIKPYIYAFHMPLFFFLYGFSQNKKFINENKIRSIIYRRFKSLIIPYILWALIYAGITPKNIIFIMYGSHISLKTVSNSSLWYLPCFFISVSIYEIIKFILNKTKFNEKIKYVFLAGIGVCLFIISLILPKFMSLGYLWGMDVALVGAFFIVIGIFSRKIIEIKDIKLKHIAFFTLFLFILTFLYKINKIDYVLMAENNYGNPIAFLISAVLGCYFVIMFSIFLDRIMKKRIKNYITFVGKNTLCIFAIQKIIISACTIIVKALNLPNIMALVIILILTLIFSSVAIIFINKFVPELNGKMIKSE